MSQKISPTAKGFLEWLQLESEDQLLERAQDKTAVGWGCAHRAYATLAREFTNLEMIERNIDHELGRMDDAVTREVDHRVDGMQFDAMWIKQHAGNLARLQAEFNGVVEKITGIVYILMGQRQSLPTLPAAEVVRNLSAKEAAAMVKPSKPSPGALDSAARATGRKIEPMTVRGYNDEQPA